MDERIEKWLYDIQFSNRILARDPEIAISNARKIVNLRNLVVHSYDAVSDENIWAIVVNNLPELKKEIQDLLLGLNTNTYHL